MEEICVQMAGRTIPATREIALGDNKKSNTLIYDFLFIRARWENLNSAQGTLPAIIYDVSPQLAVLVSEVDERLSLNNG